MGDASVPGSGASGESREPEGSPAGNGVGDAVIDSSEDDFVHESVELPDWIPVGFGLILITIAAIAIWMAAGS